MKNEFEESKKPQQPVFLGIDPGAGGGLAVLNTAGELISTFKFKDATEHDISAMFEAYSINSIALIEKVWSFPGQGVASTFKFGMSYGFLRGMLVAHKIPFTDQIPRTWQKYYSMKKNKEETGTSWKNRLKGRAQQLYPNEKITLATADAILIARYCYEQNRSK
jgi:hypothetical protein